MAGLIIPYSPVNPYQAELIKNLAKLNIDLRVSKRNKRLSVFKNRKVYQKYDFVHLHWTHSFMIGEDRLSSLRKSITFIIDLFLLRIMKVKIIWTVHNLTNHDKRNVKIEKFFLSIIARYLANQIIVHGKSIAVDIKRLYKIPAKKSSKINIIPHGNYKDYYRNQVGKEAARKFLSLDRSDFVYLFLGLIRDYKGVGYLVDQFTKMNLKDAKLLIAGMVLPSNKSAEGSLSPSIEGSENIITSFSYIPDDLLQYYLNAADVVVLPYTSISTSGSLILAMSFNKAVIIPDLGFVSEVIDSKGGIVYDSTRENALEEAMKEIRNKDVHEMGINNGHLMENLYGWKKIAYKTKLVYQKN
ncbi:glycosyltransferase [Arcticibacter tournemirensis]|uniref:Glycosyltransferase n=1 Tax=Arcticibacter tournemirensis TaxID=699437 RepID=A0A4Q0MAR8_9SPHI|nr:glycosyltransferase [Arcticibacter tournemirensis]RXF70368.1 glycosyltransferase [Arcticibacter tournemirensis]